MCGYSVFLHIASFVALLLLRASLGPSWCQLGLSRANFEDPKLAPKRNNKWDPKMTPEHSARTTTFH